MLRHRLYAGVFFRCRKPQLATTKENSGVSPELATTKENSAEKSGVQPEREMH
jgi:hypothetical protein